VNAERLCRLEVDNQLKLGDVLDRQIGGLRAANYLRSIQPDLSV
jgi:hypothetical protein